MIVLLAVTLGTGVAAAIALLPFGIWAILIGAPLTASSAAILAGGLMAWRTVRHDRRKRELDAQTSMMVSALRDVTHQADATSPAPKVAQQRSGT